MISLKEVTGGKPVTDERELVKISDKLWQIGSLEEIRQKVSSELFNLHVGMNVIGGWQNEGWWCVICEQADLVPYIPEALERLQLSGLKAAFEDIIKLFPDYTVFKADDSTYYDIVNFLQTHWFAVEDKRLQSIPLEKRKEMVAQVRKKLGVLEDLTEPVFGLDAECDGWKPVIEYISNALNIGGCE